MGFPIIPVPDTGDVYENGPYAASGDIDYLAGNDTGDWTPVTNDTSGGYGSTFNMDANGAWTFSVNPSDPDLIALVDGETVDIVFNVISTGGSSTVTITVHGFGPPCFVRGTWIDTPSGPRRIEDLKIGDEVITADQGAVKIKWVGAKKLSSDECADFDDLSPIHVAKDAFGPGVPAQPLMVSPLHRMLLRGPQTQLLFGESEVFCSAKLLLNGETVTQVQTDDVEYFHILFDEHQVITANGCDAESLYPGTIGLNRFDIEAREEIFTIFPELRSLPDSYGPAARRILKRHEAEVFRTVTAPLSPLMCA